MTEAIKLHLPHVERVFDPSRKEKHWDQRKLARGWVMANLLVIFWLL